MKRTQNTQLKEFGLNNMKLSSFLKMLIFYYKMHSYKQKGLKMNWSNIDFEIDLVNELFELGEMTQSEYEERVFKKYLKKN